MGRAARLAKARRDSLGLPSQRVLDEQQRAQEARERLQAAYESGGYRAVERLLLLQSLLGAPLVPKMLRGGRRPPRRHS